MGTSPSSDWDRAMPAVSRRKPRRRWQTRMRCTATGPTSIVCRRAPIKRGMRPTTAKSAPAPPPRCAMQHEGARVAVVSGGDPGVFAMAAAVCEEIESGPQSWRTLDVTIVPGITAMLAVAARIGAPLGHDFLRALALGQSQALGADRAPPRCGGERGLCDRALQSRVARAAVAARRRHRTAAPPSAAVDAGHFRTRGDQAERTNQHRHARPKQTQSKPIWRRW